MHNPLIDFCNLVISRPAITGITIELNQSASGMICQYYVQQHHEKQLDNDHGS